MNWNKLKTFLIVLFSALNIILIITMLTKDYKETVVPQTTIQDTVEILNKRGISIDKSIIPDRAKNMEGFPMQTIDFDRIPYRISHHSGGVFEFSVPIEIDTVKEVKKLTEKLGIGYAEFTSDASDIKNIRAVQVIDDYTIFGNYLDIEVLDKIVKVKGEWLNPSNHTLENEDEVEPSQVTSILMEFISNPDRPQGNITIKNIQFGYFAPEYTLSEEIQTMTVVPCWEIALDTGENFYYDARNGEYLK